MQLRLISLELNQVLNLILDLFHPIFNNREADFSKWNLFKLWLIISRILKLETHNFKTLISTTLISGQAPLISRISNSYLRFFFRNWRNYQRWNQRLLLMILSVFMITKRTTNRLLKTLSKRIKKWETKNKVKSLSMFQTETLRKKTEWREKKWLTNLVSAKQQWTLSNSSNQSRLRRNKRVRTSSILRASKVLRTYWSKLLIRSNLFSPFSKDRLCSWIDYRWVWWTNTEAILSAKVSFIFISTNFTFILDHVLDLITQLTKIVPEWICMKAHP